MKFTLPTEITSIWNINKMGQHLWKVGVLWNCMKIKKETLKNVEAETIRLRKPKFNTNKGFNDLTFLR
jgi:hypothetical protein